MSKMEKLIQVLETAANAVTPTSGGSEPLNNGHYHDANVTLVDVSYRIGRALTLARDIARDSD